jgi:hypothetical protein
MVLASDLLPRLGQAMKVSNPFQIPACLQRADERRRRQERFKHSVVGVVAALAALLVILLIQGCVSEQAKAHTDHSGGTLRGK